MPFAIWFEKRPVGVDAGPRRCFEKKTTQYYNVATTGGPLKPGASLSGNDQIFVELISGTAPSFQHPVEPILSK